MTVKLVGSTSGSVSLQAPASTTGGAHRVLTLPDVNGTVATTATAGKILKVVSTTKTDYFTTNTATSFVDVTGLSIAYTPTAANSNILISGYVSWGLSTSGTYRAAFRLMRDSTPISVYAGSDIGNRTAATFGAQGIYSTESQNQAPFQFLDDPTYTLGNSITYKLQALSESGQTVYVNKSGTENDGDNVLVPRFVSTFTLMEVAA
tara:strand:- start:20 stop:637 length:618 start_codon:yes stop_codon:yes gene_type:complete